MRTVAVSLVALLPFFSACEADLGECDSVAAKAVFYDGLGQPAYAGQALMTSTCGGSGGFCHVSSARGAQRFGVPAGFNFDVALATSAASTDTLRSGVDRIRDEADDIWYAVDTDYMPTLSRFHENVSAFRDAANVALPRLDTSAGKRTLRNWLACGAPVVERTTERPSGISPVGDIVAATTPRLAGNWDSLYANIVGPICAQCHVGDSPSGNLNMGDIDTAYANLLGDGEGNAAMGPECGGTTEIRVIPNDADGSLLIHKIEGVNAVSAPVCGSRMPLEMTPLSAEAIQAFRDWIDAGALREDS